MRLVIEESGRIFRGVTARRLVYVSDIRELNLSDGDDKLNLIFYCIYIPDGLTDFIARQCDQLRSINIFGDYLHNKEAEILSVAFSGLHKLKEFSVVVKKIGSHGITYFVQHMPQGLTSFSFNKHKTTIAGVQGFFIGLKYNKYLPELQCLSIAVKEDIDPGAYILLLYNFNALTQLKLFIIRKRNEEYGFVFRRQGKEWLMIEEECHGKKIAIEGSGDEPFSGCATQGGAEGSAAGGRASSSTLSVSIAEVNSYDWKGGKYTGFCLQRYDETIIPSGEGTFVDDLGNKYVGHYVNGKMSGEGKLTIGNALYVGEFLHDKMHGIGKLENDDEVYKGFYKDGEHNGKGIAFYSDGALQIGESVNGVFSDGVTLEFEQEEEGEYIKFSVLQNTHIGTVLIYDEEIITKIRTAILNAKETLELEEGFKAIMKEIRPLLIKHLSSLFGKDTERVSGSVAPSLVQNTFESAAGSSR